MSENPKPYRDLITQYTAEKIERFLTDPTSRRERVTFDDIVGEPRPPLRLKSYPEMTQLIEDTLNKLNPHDPRVRRKGPNFKMEELETDVPGVKLAKETRFEDDLTHIHYVLFEGEW